MIFSSLNRSRMHLPKRSEEHTSELQSQSNLVCRLLLEKKKDSQDFVVLRALFETQSALVRNLRGRLQQDQALLRRERVEPAGKPILCQVKVTTHHNLAE